MRIEDWYRSNGIFGSVKDDIDARKKSLTTGEYVFDVEEVEVGEVRLRFVDKKGNEVAVRAQISCHTTAVQNHQHAPAKRCVGMLHATYM
jgi:hypothetical protein